MPLNLYLLVHLRVKGELLNFRSAKAKIILTANIMIPFFDQRSRLHAIMVDAIDVLQSLLTCAKMYS
jgi:hypothetical protein